MSHCRLLVLFFLLDAIGFGIRRQKSGNSYFPAIFKNLPWDDDESELNFAFGFRGVYSSVKFDFHGAIPLEPSAKSNIALSLQRAARYELQRLKRASLVRQSGGLACGLSTTDFSRLIMSSHLLGGYSATPDNLLHCTANQDTLRSLFCLSRETSDLLGLLGITRLEELRSWWRMAQGETLEQKLSRCGVLRQGLECIQRHSVPKIAIEILRFLFYQTLTFEETS